MAINDVYQVRVKQVWGSIEELLNVFYYRASEGGSGDSAADLLTTFQSSLWNDIRAILPVVDVTTQFFIINIRVPTDYAGADVTLAGTSDAIGYAPPPFICTAVRSSPPAPGGRYSYHRFPIPSTSVITEGGGFEGGFVDDIEDAVNNLNDGMNGTGGGYYLPVQVRAGWVYGVAPTVNRLLTGAWGYNLYPSTQNTRKGAFRSWVVPA